MSVFPTVLAQWEIDRPRSYVLFPDERVENSTTDGNASVGLGIQVCNYLEQDPSQDNDGMWLRVVGTANTRKGVDYTLYDSSYAYSWVEITNPIGSVSGDVDTFFVEWCSKSSDPIRFYGGPGSTSDSGEYYYLYGCRNGWLWLDYKIPGGEPPYPYAYYSESIPNTIEPNCFIAPFWKQLNLAAGGEIEIKWDVQYIWPPGYSSNRWCLIISWINVPDKYDVPQTFQAIIELMSWNKHGSSHIWFQYKSITTNDPGTRIGIEDQGGWKGRSCNVGNITNGKALCFKQNSPAYYIQYITVKISCNDPYSDAIIDTTPEWIRGRNVELTQGGEQEDDTLTYVEAFGGGFTLLVDAWEFVAPGAVPALLSGAALLIGGGLLVLAAVDYIARHQPQADLVINSEENWVKATAPHSSQDPLYATAVDADICFRVYWEFFDHPSHDKTHSITITTELTYFAVDIGVPECPGPPVYQPTINASTTLTVVPDVGDNLATAKLVTPGNYRGCLDGTDTVDVYKVYVASGMGLHLTMKPPNNTNFNLYLYNPSGTLVKWSEKGVNVTEEISYPTTVGGNWSIMVTKITGRGIYNLTIDEPYPAPKLTVLTKTTGGSSISGVEVYVDLNWYPSPIIDKFVTRGTHTITTRAYFQIGDYAYTFRYWENGHMSNTRTLDIQSDKTITAYYSVEYVPPLPPGCPYVYTWNGTAYVLDNNILGASEVSNGTDVEDYYRLEQTFIPTFQCAWFSLYSMQISEFEHEHSYIDKVRLYAVDHDANVNVAVTPEGQILTYANPNMPISALDNYGYDWLPFVSTPDNIYYRGFPGDYLLLDFGNIDTSQAAKLVLRANAELKKDECIHVQTLNETSQWTDAAVLRTRNHWSTIILDLADYLPNPDGTLKMRLYFTGIHKIDYIGLDTTPQANITITQTAAFLAVHSTQGDVTLKLLLNDQKYAELLPGEQITLKFILPNTQKTRTFITYTEGHYYKIQ